MRAPVSIIIPTLNAAGELPGCLAALVPGLQAGLIREVVISDGGSGDGTAGIASEAGAVWVSGEKGRGGQLRRGAEAAQGEWLLFLHADSWLAEGWAEAVLAHLAEDADRAGYFALRFRARGTGARMVAGWANARSRVFGLPYGDQGLLISRALYDRVGGFADMPLMEDVDMARRLRGRLRALECRVETGAERYLAEGWMRRGARKLWTLGRYFCGVAPERLVRGYEKGR